MSADVDLLRRAAALMRERAEACGTDPRDDSPVRWIYTRATPEALKPFPENGLPDGVLVRSYQRRDPVQAGDWIIATHWEEDGEHIASWHPGMALMVADWLDDIATRRDDRTQVAAVRHVDFDRALDLARTYLREQS